MKKIIAKSIMTMGVLALAACGNSQAPVQESSSSTAPEEAKTLVISTFGLNQDIVQEVVMNPFAQANNATVTLEVGNASERLTKLKSGAESGIDVIELSQSNAGQGAKDELFEKITTDQVPNITNLTDGAKKVFESGVGVPYAVNSIGIIYDKEALGKEITSWDDLWSEDLVGKLAIPDISTTFGPAMIYLASEHKNVDLESDKGVAAFEALKELAPNVVKTYAKSSDLANMFQAGEIQVAVVADFAYGVVKKAKDNVTYVVPESGTIANYNTINIAKNAKNKELALKYIDWRISKDLLKQTATAFNEAPVNKLVELTTEEAGNKTYGEVAKRAKVMNTPFINENMPQWLGQWNELLNK